MREFMTRLSDYFDEWRNDPERKENQLSVAVIGAVSVVIIVLVILLLWWGHGVQEQKKEEAAQKAAKLQAQQEMDADSRTGEDGIGEGDFEQGLVAATYQEKMAEYMSMDSGEALRQEYLTNTNALKEEIKELQTTMERAQTEIAAVTKEYRDGDANLTEKLVLLEKETQTIVENIGALEEKLSSLSEIIRTADGEKIPAIQEQIRELRREIEQARAGMSGVHEKIKSLEKEDGKLWEMLSQVQKSLETALGENLREIDKRMDHLDDHIEKLQNEFRAALEKMGEKMNEKVDALASDALGYRYEKETNTLYLMPNRK